VTFPQTISPGQANPETPFQEDLRALQGASAYGRRDAAISGLTFAWHGDPSVPVADGTQALGASTTTYMVVDRSTRAVSFSTSNTNWNNGTAYGRAWRLVTSGSGITTIEDWRFRELGISAGGGSGSSATGMSGLRFTSDTGSTADSDPGAGLFKWNNATQGSATKLFVDDLTNDGVSLATYFGSLGTAGEIFIQQSDDPDRWQLWRWTAVANDTGYRDFTVTLQANSGSDIQDDKECYFDFEEDDAGSSGMATDTLWNATGDLAYGTGSDTATRLPIGTARQKLRVNSGTTAPEWVDDQHCIAIACSDETTALTAGTAKVTFRMPYAFTLTDVRASVTTAPTGGTLLTVDINENGSTILSTKLTFDASEKTTTTAATPRVISDSSLADDAEITIDIDAVGSTIAGAGLKVYLIGTRT
jgi:hypothetical protein